MQLENFVHVESAAKIIGCTTARVRQLLKEGTITGEKFGPRMWLVDRKSATKYAKTECLTGRPRTRQK